ncbi:mersacidin/lichenicidin family type 2 lantibiotic [Hyalangium versicolor]|uniref:mersacidin/lichenicidin family type 2 lantibiotic n=1 Tax=Hyalangium versicolor TaxID=2861190 RepID=UPI001CCABCA0|nr:mersacidin/lichenicidin family type 2 lantibiotic [Hyalangium versicolor]
MKRETIIRAWKDPEFRASLTPEERSALPDCPAGPAFTDLDESELADAVGGAGYYLDFDEGCICSKWTATKTFTTTTREFTVNQLDFATLEAVNVARF